VGAGLDGAAGDEVVEVARGALDGVGRVSSRPPTAPGPSGGGGAVGRLPPGGGAVVGAPGLAGGGAGLPHGAVVDDVGFFSDVVVGPAVDVVVTGSWVTVVVVGAVVVVGRAVVVVVAGGWVVVGAGGAFVVVVVVGAAVLVVVGGSVDVVVSGGTVDVVVSGGTVDVVVSGGTVDVVVSSGGAVSGDVVSGDGQSTGWAGSAGGGQPSSAPAIGVAKGPVGPAPGPATPSSTAAPIRETVSRRWAADVDTGLTSSRVRAYPADSRRAWLLVRL
jgi:hypothetical protein